MSTTSKTPVSFDPVPKDSPISLLLSKYNEGHGCFITHLDKSPVSTKFYAFLSPLAMSSLWAALIAWRITTAAHHYLSFIPLHIIAEGFITQSPAPRISTVSLAANILFDLFLYFDIWPILRTFISGHLWLRIRYGFRETEVIFRRPSKWRLKMLKNLHAEERDKRFVNALYRAIDRTLVNHTTGILTGDDFWVLDYSAACEAYGYLQSGEIDEDTWKLGVWQKSGDHWAVWQVWKAHEDDETANWLEKFRVKLESLGKVGLFQMWMDLLARETTGPDGRPRPWTSESHRAVIELFASEGVDFERLGQEMFNEVDPAAEGAV